jgi:hypothetical protein
LLRVFATSLTAASVAFSTLVADMLMDGWRVIDCVEVLEVMTFERWACAKATSERAWRIGKKARGLNSVAMRREIDQGSFVP